MRVKIIINCSFEKKNKEKRVPDESNVCWKKKKSPYIHKVFFPRVKVFFFFILLFVKRLILPCVTFSPLLKTTLTWIEVVLAFFEDSNWILFLSVSFRIIFFLLTLSQFRFEKIYIFTQTHLSMWFLSVFFLRGWVFNK